MESGDRSPWLVTGGDLRDGLLGLIPTSVAVLVAAAVIDGLQIAGPHTAVGVAGLVAAGDALVRPALRWVAGRSGAIVALLFGVGSQILLVTAALALVPGVRVAAASVVAHTLLVVAAFGVVTRWAIGVNDCSYLVADLLRRARARRRRARAGPLRPAGPPGLVVVQWDGVPTGLLDHGLLAGTVPTLARWVRSGSHRATWWWARIPATTPASQAGLLHGSSRGIPAFRWYEKGSGRLIVASRPEDARLIESRLPVGGLLSGGGVSISNLFSGGAATCQLVVSRVGTDEGFGPGRDYLRFFASPFVFVRALLLAVGEMVKELWQGRQQRLRNIEPRVRRPGSFVLLRALTNTALRDLNVALVAEHMMAGAPVIYVDFVDYDEVAHHAGVARSESMAALAGLDRTLGVLEQVADAADREYRFVVVSDHGLSQGPTFRQLTGRSLEEHLRRLIGADPADTVVSIAADDVSAQVNALLSELLGSGRTASRWAGRGSGGGTSGAPLASGPRAPEPGRAAPADGAAPELVVVGSGNLGLVWFPRLSGRVELVEVRGRYPALLPGLLATRGIGFVVGHSDRGPVAVGPHGLHVLELGQVEGIDPLLPFGPRAAADLARVAAMDQAADLFVHSALDPRTGEVHAFEELVGSHGGLGGWQNTPILVHPADWSLDEDLLDRTVPGERILVGAENVHRQLVRWLERAGTRAPTTSASRRVNR